MIRFNCSHCARLYELPEALARLALVCKGCGQPLAVPEVSTAPVASPSPSPSPTPPAPSPPVPGPARVPPPVPAKADLPPAPSASPAHQAAQTPIAAVTATESRLPPPEMPHTNGPLTAHPRADALFESPDVLDALDEKLPLAAAAPAERPRSRKLLGTLVDAGMAIVLVVVGVICGELLARRSTGDVLRDASTAARFPPVDLLMWLAPTLLLLLVYALLISRRKSLGNIVGRRGEV